MTLDTLSSISGAESIRRRRFPAKVTPVGSGPHFGDMIYRLAFLIGVLGEVAVPLAEASCPVLLQSQVDVLRQIGSQSGSGFTGFKSWTAKGEPVKCCDYYGLSCDLKGQIIGINVTGANLKGPIDAFANLLFLKTLHLSSNVDVKAIPLAFTKLKNLQHLDVYDCWIEGQIPAFLGQLSALTFLSIGGNPLVGAVPASLGNLTKLVSLNIARTGEDGVGGPLPASLANLKNLKELYLRNNRFNGPLPAFLGNIASLEMLMISKNYWSGNVPASFAKLKKIKYLGLRETSLEGFVPTFLGTLTTLTYLSLSDTGLYGVIPKELNALVNLRELYLQTGWFYGPVPDLVNLKKLTQIDLSDNYLSGPVPSFLSRVKTFSIASNYFSGSASSIPCSDTRSIEGNCLSSVPTKCGGSAKQKTTQECNKFCGTAMTTGACSGKGVCMPDMKQMLATRAFVPICKCQKGYWPSHKKLRCSKNSN